MPRTLTLTSRVAEHQTEGYLLEFTGVRDEDRELLHAEAFSVSGQPAFRCEVGRTPHLIDARVLSRAVHLDVAQNQNGLRLIRSW